MISYNTDADSVEPVFYPVVPDSFMSRGEEQPAAPSFHNRSGEWRSGEWPEQIDGPQLWLRDRWSF